MTKKIFTALAAIALLAISACTQDEVDKFLNSVTSIKLDQTQVEMTVGETLTLIATVDPFNGDTKDVTWTSSSPEVASVKGTEIPDVTGINMPAGEVTALKEGETTITAKAGDKTATCKVIVKKKGQGGGDKVQVTEVKLDKTNLELEVGQGEQLTATVLPENATDKTVTWSSSNPEIAAVAESDGMADGSVVKGGYVTAKKPGEAVITAKAGDKEASCKVVVKQGGSSDTLESITLQPASMEIEIDEEVPLKAILAPANVQVTITWECNNPNAVVISKKSATEVKVRGVIDGNYTITASAGGKSAVCQVTVKKSSVVSVESVSLDKTELELEIGAEEQLTATVLPENATHKTVTWSSNNTPVATVADGKVTAVAVGTATITASVGSISAQCIVTVKEPVYDEVVDLGLPSGVKWRAWNLGANNIHEIGDFYAWGEVETYYGSFYYSTNSWLNVTDFKEGKEWGYNWRSYRFRVSGFNAWDDEDPLILTKYNSQERNGVVDNKTRLDPEDDAANVILGNGWRMPTKEECQELLDYCDMEYLPDAGGYNIANTVRHFPGRKFTSKINGKSIVLPCAGHIYNDIYVDTSGIGVYWTADAPASVIMGEERAASYAWSLSVTVGSQPPSLGNTSYRIEGYSIRPVKD